MLKLLYTNYVRTCVIMFYCIYDIVLLTIHDYLSHCVIAGGRHTSTLECLHVCLHDIIFLIIEIKSFLFFSYSYSHSTFTYNSEKNTQKDHYNTKERKENGKYLVTLSAVTFKYDQAV